MNKVIKIELIVVGVIAVGIAGFGIGLWADSGSDRVTVKTKTVEVPRSAVDTSTDACVKQGGVPTYSAWDGGLNGCIMVGQSSRDSNVEIKK